MSNARNLADLLGTDTQIQSADIASLAASKLTGQVPDANAPSGSVINTWLARSESTSAFSTSSTSLQNVTALDVTLTPQSASSKFLITCYLVVGKYGWQHGEFRFGLARNSSTIYGEYISMIHFGADDSNSQWDGMDSANFSFLDSPNTTSSITYRPQLGAWTSSYPINLNRAYYNANQRGVSYMMVQEIAP